MSAAGPLLCVGCIPKALGPCIFSFGQHNCSTARVWPYNTIHLFYVAETSGTSSLMFMLSDDSPVYMHRNSYNAYGWMVYQYISIYYGTIWWQAIVLKFSGLQRKRNFQEKLNLQGWKGDLCRDWYLRRRPSLKLLLDSCPKEGFW